MSTPPANDPTARARAGVRRTRWPAVLAGVGGAVTVGALGAAGLAPLLAGLGVGTLVVAPAVEWLTSMGMNALAGWVGNLAADGLRAPFAEDEPPDPAWLADVGLRLDAAAAADATLAAQLARLLTTIDAVPQSLAAIAEEVGAQSDVILEQYALLKGINADIERLGIQSDALSQSLVSEADRVIAAITARTDARFDQVLAELTALRDQQRQALISISGQTRDVKIGDVAGRDMHKPHIEPGGIYAPYGTVYPPSPPRSSIYDSAPEFAEQGIFVGRDSLLTKIRARLAARPAARVALVGIPGSGKSRLARALFHNPELRSHFQGGILCAALGQSPSMELHITRWFREVIRGVDPQRLTIEQQAEQLRQHIAADERPWLCILDDLWSVQDITAFQTLLGVPALLITTRQQDVIEQLGDALRSHEDVFSIGKLDRSAAVDLLRERAGIASTEYDGELDDLAALAGDLPLALTIVGGFLQGRTKRTAWMEKALQALARADAHESIDQIAQNYGRRRSWLRWLFGTEPIDKRFDVDRLIQLSYKLLPRDAQRAIIRLAALPPDPLSFDDQAASVVVDTRGDALQDALLLLSQRSLITTLQQDDRFQMHRRVWEWAQRQAPQELQAAQERWRSWRLGASPEEAAERNMWMQNRHNAELLLHAWRDACGENDESRFDAAALRMMVFAAIPTLVLFGYGSVVLSSLAQVARFFEQHRDMQAAGVAYMYLAGIERGRAEFAEARTHANRALGLLQAAADEVGQAVALSILGLVAQDEGQYEKAKPLFREALEVAERVLGADHPYTATSLNNLANLLHVQGDYASARPLLERALAINERVLGTNHPDTATSLNNLAGILDSQGDYAAARSLYERALTLRESILGADHPDTAISIGNLAGILRAQGDYAAARPLVERALAISERVFGTNHPHTARSLDNLASILQSQGDYAAALPLHERALAINEGVLGTNHPDTAISLNNLAGILQSQGDYASALPLYERALAISERVLGADHPDTAISLNNLASIFQRQGDYAAALPLYERALTISERILGTNHPDTAIKLNNLAVCYAHQGDFIAAIPLIERVLVIRLRTLGPDNPDTVSTQRTLNDMHRIAASQPPTDPFAPLLAALAALAAGDETQRDVAQAKLVELDATGRNLSTLVERIRDGDRDADTLTQGLDAQDTALIKRILALIAPSSIFQRPASRPRSPKRIATEAEAAVQSLLGKGSPSEREALTTMLEEQARWADISVQYHGHEWAELATHLRSLAEQLRYP